MPTIAELTSAIETFQSREDLLEEFIASIHAWDRAVRSLNASRRRSAERGLGIGTHWLERQAAARGFIEGHLDDVRQNLTATGQFRRLTLLLPDQSTQDFDPLTDVCREDDTGEEIREFLEHLVRAAVEAIRKDARALQEERTWQRWNESQAKKKEEEPSPRIPWHEWVKILAAIGGLGGIGFAMLAYYVRHEISDQLQSKAGLTAASHPPPSARDPAHQPDGGSKPKGEAPGSK